jgi:hypothetical protein
MRIAVLCMAAIALAGCDPNSFEEGGSSFANVSRDRGNPCRVMITDAGRSSPPIKAFSAQIEGCVQETKR